MTSWLSTLPDSDFSVHNLPFGVFTTASQTEPRVGVAIGDQIVDMAFAADMALFDAFLSDKQRDVFHQPTLNDFILLGRAVWQQVRATLQTELTNDDSLLRKLAESALIPQVDATMHLPVQIGDYTDFYSSIDHASNVGKMFRDPANALLPNWRHMPVGYHGRASSVVVSGTPIRRPNGQRLPKGETQPIFGPSQRLDFELETAFIVGKDTPLGSAPLSTADFGEHVFGMVLFNDWSARDIQRWEYQPLGPFLGKNFASSLSAWVLPFDDLEPFRMTGMLQEPSPLPYLQSSQPGHFDLDLSVWLQPTDGDEVCIARSNARYLYWSFAQMIAHHTIGGCNLAIGDVLATGTISGPEPGSYGSLLEISWNGERPLHLSHSVARTFLADGDTLTLRGRGFRHGFLADLGDVTGTIQS